MFKRDLRVSTHKCKVRIQSPKIKRSVELETLALMGSRLVLQIPL